MKTSAKEEAKSSAKEDVKSQRSKGSLLDMLGNAIKNSVRQFSN